MWRNIIKFGQVSIYISALTTWDVPYYAAVQLDQFSVTKWQRWACCAEERKSARLFLLRRNVKLGLKKRNCALYVSHFKTHLLIATFMTAVNMVQYGMVSNY